MIGIDTELVLSAGFTGINTKACDMLAIRLKHNDTDNLRYATKMQVVLHCDNVMSIRDSGIEVLD